MIRQAERLSDKINLSPSDGGLHLVGQLPDDSDDTAIAKSALQQGIHAWPLSVDALDLPVAEFVDSHTGERLIVYSLQRWPSDDAGQATAEVWDR